MMFKMRLFVLACLAAVCIATPSLAQDEYLTWQDSLGRQLEWYDDVNGVCTLTTEFDMEALTPYELWGPAPTPDDPNVEQTIRNRTQTYWTDWHVTIEHGIYVDGTAIVKNLQAQSPVWVIEPFTDGSGFTAHVVSGMNTQVDYMEQLYVYFSYLPDGSGEQVRITQYPTHDYPVPEPASMVCLLSGLAVIGFRVRRRA